MTRQLFATCLLLAALLAAGSMPIDVKAAALHQPPAGLTHSGVLLWNLEGLLHREFSRHGPCIRQDRTAHTPWNFTDRCNVPLAYQLLWSYTFKSVHQTSFHLANRSPQGLIFGNYPQAVLVLGHLVACDGHETRFLTASGAFGGLFLLCLKTLDHYRR
jgi:hypothetical protein